VKVMSTRKNFLSDIKIFIYATCVIQGIVDAFAGIKIFFLT
jgi:hypothetical protein